MKLNQSKEWFSQRADLESNHEVTAMKPESQHTAEPWLVTDEGSQIVIQTFAEHPTGTIARVYRTDKRAHADAARLVECVNACMGIPDPASAVPALVAALEGVLIDIHNQRTGWGDTQFLKMAEARIRAALALAQGGKR